MLLEDLMGTHPSPAWKGWTDGSVKQKPSNVQHPYDSKMSLASSQALPQHADIRRHP